jgi:hypothetical protein
MWISFGNFYDCEVFKWRFSFVTMLGSLLSTYFLPSLRAHIACNVSSHFPTLYGHGIHALDTRHIFNQKCH